MSNVSNVSNLAPKIRASAFAEPPAPEKAGPITLQVYVINESSGVLWILDDLDSINIPPGHPGSSETFSDADLIHIDFGESGEARFIQVPPGECVRMALLLTKEQLALLTRAKQMRTTVKFRAVADEKGDVTKVLLSAMVFNINR